MNDVGSDNPIQGQLHAGVVLEAANVVADVDIVVLDAPVGVKADQCTGSSYLDAVVFIVGVVNDDLQIMRTLSGKPGQTPLPRGDQSCVFGGYLLNNAVRSEQEVSNLSHVVLRCPGRHATRQGVNAAVKRILD